jgi:hypothetical protein
VYRFEGEYRLRANVWARDDNLLSSVFGSKVLGRFAGN